MTATAAALAAIIRTGTEAEIATAYCELIARAGHDAADEIWSEAHDLVDAEHAPVCPRCHDRHAVDDCPSHEQAG